MKIEHIAVYFKDLESGKEFFETYFGAVSGGIYHNINTGFKSYFLSFEDGARLEIMTREDLTDGSATELRTGYIHIAFSVGSREAVDSLTNKLQAAGYKVLSGPRITGDGYYESCILGPENNRIEITV